MTDQAPGADMAAPSKVQHELVIDHLRLAGRLARRYRGRGVETDDLEQVARLALVKAAAGFDPDVGDFAPFATATISGELKRHFRDRAWMVRPPRAVQDLQARLGAEHAGVDVTTANVGAIADLMGVVPGELLEAAAARGCYSPASLESASVAGRERGAPDPRLDFAEDWASFTRICRTLPRADRELLGWRFVEDLTQQHIADRLGISQMQVSRRLSALLKRLRAEMVDSAQAA